MLIQKSSCHCGKVQFEVEASENITVHEFNCSICSMTGFLHLIVSDSRFRLISGEDNLNTYTFNTYTARYTFCK